MLSTLRALNRRRLAARREQRHADDVQRRIERFLRKHPAVPLGPQAGRTLSLAHSGNAGDVIYALPAAGALAGGQPFRLFLKAGVDSGLPAGSHPVGNVRLDDAMIARLVPLLQAQQGIASAARHAGEPLDADLDAFRDAPIDTERGHIARWYCAVFAVSVDLSRPWLSVPPLPGLEDTVVVARSSRYRNPALDWRALRRLPKLAFVGLEPEFDDLRRLLPSLEFVRTDDFLHLARVIRGCRFFVGNQSAPFALAEALKVPRILEAYGRLPNVIPDGEGGYEAWMQPQFEFLLQHLLERTG